MDSWVLLVDTLVHSTEKTAVGETEMIKFFVGTYPPYLWVPKRLPGITVVITRNCGVPAGRRKKAKAPPCRQQLLYSSTAAVLVSSEARQVWLLFRLSSGLLHGTVCPSFVTSTWRAGGSMFLAARLIFHPVFFYARIPGMILLHPSVDTVLSPFSATAVLYPHQYCLYEYC